MANEHIGRLEKIGLGKETTPGTSVAAAVWIPKTEGKLNPKTEKAKDNSAWGNIDELRDSQTVGQSAEIDLKGIVRSTLIGHILQAAFGQSFPCLKCTKSGGSGTLAVGDTVTGGTSSAVGVIKRIDGTTLYISITSGTFQTGELITGAPSGGTGNIAFDTVLRTHLFTRLNSNTHPSYTIYGVDDVATYKSTYCLLDSLDLEITAKGFLTFTAKYKGMKQVSGSGTPAFTTTEYAFLGKHTTLKLASALSGLGAASAVDVMSLKLSIAKNLELYQASGSDDVKSIHNKQFKVAGEITALFNSATLQALDLASTKQAMRIACVNSDVTIGTAGNPTLQLDLAQCSFENWTKNGSNDDLVTQTLGFEGEFSVGDSETIAAMLQNIQTTAY
jgi:hypothetical protein